MSLTSLAALQAVAAETSTEAWLALIKIDHADFGSPLRFVVNTTDITSNGDVFSASLIDVQLLSQSPDQIEQARLTLDAVDGMILLALDGLESPATVDITVVLASDLDTVILSQLGLRLTSMAATLVRLEATLTGPRFVTEIVPSLRMTRDTFGGIFR